MRIDSQTRKKAYRLCFQFIESGLKKLEKEGVKNEVTEFASGIGLTFLEAAEVPPLVDTQ